MHHQLFLTATTACVSARMLQSSLCRILLNSQQLIEQIIFYLMSRLMRTADTS